LPFKTGTGEPREQPGEALKAATGTGDQREKPGKALTRYFSELLRSRQRLEAYGQRTDMLQEVMDPDFVFRRTPTQTSEEETDDVTVQDFINQGFAEAIAEVTTRDGRITARRGADVARVLVHEKGMLHCHMSLTTQGSNQHAIRFSCQLCDTVIARWSYVRREFIRDLL